MKLAIIGDIHANAPALQAVLTDISKRNVDAIICTGDIVGYLPYPNEVIDLLKQAHVLCVQGNHDAKYGKLPAKAEVDEVTLQAKASFIWTQQTLTALNHAYLANLPTQLVLEFANQRLQVVHGSHRTNTEYVFADDEQLATIAAEIDATIFISGHTHLAYAKVVADVLFINPGSVGKPKLPGAIASYALCEISTLAPNVELVEVAYDQTDLVTAITKTKGIDCQLATLFQ
ncbi:MAG: metallophosphoesterase family protein [Culicoidibacterales bacterium]